MFTKQNNDEPSDELIEETFRFNGVSPMFRNDFLEFARHGRIANAVFRMWINVAINYQRCLADLCFHFGHPLPVYENAPRMQPTYRLPSPIEGPIILEFPSASK